MFQKKTHTQRIRRKNQIQWFLQRFLKRVEIAIASDGENHPTSLQTLERKNKIGVIAKKDLCNEIQTSHCNNITRQKNNHNLPASQKKEKRFQKHQEQTNLAPTAFYRMGCTSVGSDRIVSYPTKELPMAPRMRFLHTLLMMRF